MKATEKQNAYYKSLRNRRNYKEEWKNLKKNLKGMTFGEKVEHLWEYYKGVLFFVIVIVLVVSLVLSMTREKSMIYLAQGVGSNVEITDAGRAYLQTAFYDKYKTGDKHETVAYYESEFGDLSDATTTSDIEFSYNAAYGVIAQIAAGSIDYLLMSVLSMQFYTHQDVYMDLYEAFSKEEIEALGDKVVWLKMTEDAETSIPISVCIDEYEFTKDCVVTKGPIYLSFSATSTPEKVRRIFDHITSYVPQLEESTIN